ncbi:MAG: hypothetical protein P8174_10940 [Gemmatimonadota bacterium]
MPVIQRQGRGTRGRVVAVGFGLLAGLTLAGPTTAQQARAGAGDAIAIMDTLDALPTNGLWPGFKPDSVPAAIFDGEHTYLFRHPAPPANFKPLAGRPDVRVTPGLDAAVRANSFASVNGVLTAVVMLNLLSDYPTARDRAGVVLHESFHVFERRAHPDWGANEFDLFVYPVSAARPLALRRLENRALRNALAAATPEKRAAWAAAAMQIRQERFAALPPSAAAYERGTELMEGLAQWIQHRATGTLTGAAPLPDTGYAPADVRLRAYATSLAIARLLDALVPGWQDGVDNGRTASLDQALAAGLHQRFPDVKPADWRGGLPAALRRATAQTTALVARRDSIRRAFMTRPGWRIEVLAAEGHPLRLRGMDPMNITRLAGNELLHTRWLRLGTPHDTLEVLDGSALTDGAGTHPLADGIRSATATGLEQPTIDRTDQVVTVTAPGFKGSFTGAHVNMDRQAQVVRIRLAQPAP